MRAPAASPAADDKRRAFDCFYRGWDDFMNARVRNPPVDWGFRERDLYFRGYGAAHAAAERFRNNP